MSGHYVPQTMSSENGMFTEAEETKLQTFLNNLETVDTDVQLEKKNETTSKRKSEKKRTTPYQKKGKSPKGRARKQPHELLSEEQKKANHIASEQKRRANIRVGFDQLVNIVPTLDSYHRSESVILQKSVKYIRDLIKDKKELKLRVKELQTMLGEFPNEDSSEDEIEFY